jgi:uncharacterized SAM-binding protein YcdF (DUF218 family)
VTNRVDRAVSDTHRRDAEAVWDFHQMRHELRPCTAAVALGSYDLGVAEHTATLWHEGMFPVVVFTGANSPVTADRFPRGEAVHYRERALELGVPDEAILVEPNATNTGQNIEFSQQGLHDAGIHVDSLMLVSMRYMERRAYATCAKQWPGIEIVCASASLTYIEYVATIGDEKLVIDELVGDLQRVLEYPKLGFAIEQDVPADVRGAYQRLLRDGFDSRFLIT